MAGEGRGVGSVDPLARKTFNHEGHEVPRRMSLIETNSLVYLCDPRIRNHFVG